MSYTPPAGNAVAFLLNGAAYSPPVGNDVLLDLSGLPTIITEATFSVAGGSTVSFVGELVGVGLATLVASSQAAFSGAKFAEIRFSGKSFGQTLFRSATVNSGILAGLGQSQFQPLGAGILTGRVFVAQGSAITALQAGAVRGAGVAASGHGAFGPLTEFAIGSALAPTGHSVASFAGSFTTFEMLPPAEPTGVITVTERQYVVVSHG